MVSRKFIKMCTAITRIHFWNILFIPREPVPQAHIQSSISLALANRFSTSISVFEFSECFYEWKHVAYSLLCLGSVTKCDD